MVETTIYLSMKKIIINESQFKILLEMSDIYDKCNRWITNGYIVHGTNAKFNEFSPAFIQGGARAKEGYGIYFTDTAYKAIEYGQIIKAVPKDKFNFIELTESVEYGSQLYNQLFGNEENKKKRKELEYEIEYLMNDGKYREALDLYKEIDKLGDSDSDGVLYGPLRDNCLLAIETYGAKNLGSLQDKLINPNVNLPRLAQVLRTLGYDGGHYGNVYTIWNFEKLNENLIDITESDNIL